MKTKFTAFTVHIAIIFIVTSSKKLYNCTCYTISSNETAICFTKVEATSRGNAISAFHESLDSGKCAGATYKDCKLETQKPR